MSKRSLSSSESSTSSKSSKLQDTRFLPTSFSPSRVRYVTNHTTVTNGDCVVVWMSREQRVSDNYALLCAQDLAIQRGIPIRVVFNLVPKFLQATIRQYGFMIEGLKQVEQQLRSQNVPFHLTWGDPAVTIPDFVRSKNGIALITDFSPLRISRGWLQAVSGSLDEGDNPIPVIQVDAHNIVPCWIASNKLEYGARTIRSKIQKLLPEYLLPFPSFHGNPNNLLISDAELVDWTTAVATLEIDRSIKEVTWLKPGENGAREMLESFVSERLKSYAEKRNDPNESALSNLSPYFHFGQLSPQRAIMFVKDAKIFPNSTDSFVEEAIIRRELSDNFCYYNPRYDSLEGCYDWAKETLRAHESDPRQTIYTLEELEAAKTHDDLWNAAQLQVVREGKMHGFLRMYWAKKILEWTVSPQEALRIAIYLNDRYQLDGRDANGYVGCMWSIGGIHDQGWGERPIFGKIRYMNYKGCQRKFDVAKFVSKYPPAVENAKKAISSGKGSYDS